MKNRSPPGASTAELLSRDTAIGLSTSPAHARFIRA
jgi:hypothetical protein